jgi:hypothetical protein
MTEGARIKKNRFKKKSKAFKNRLKEWETEGCRLESKRKGERTREMENRKQKASLRPASASFLEAL